MFLLSFQVGLYSFAYGMKIIPQKQLVHRANIEPHTLCAFIFGRVVWLLLGKVCLGPELLL